MSDSRNDVQLNLKVEPTTTESYDHEQQEPTTTESYDHEQQEPTTTESYDHEQQELIANIKTSPKILDDWALDTKEEIVLAPDFQPIVTKIRRKPVLPNVPLNSSLKREAEEFPVDSGVQLIPVKSREMLDDPDFPFDLKYTPDSDDDDFSVISNEEDSPVTTRKSKAHKQKKRSNKAGPKRKKLKNSEVDQPHRTEAESQVAPEIPFDPAIVHMQLPKMAALIPDWVKRDTLEEWSEGRILTREESNRCLLRYSEHVYQINLNLRERVEKLKKVEKSVQRLDELQSKVADLRSKLRK